MIQSITKYSLNSNWVKKLLLFGAILFGVLFSFAITSNAQELFNHYQGTYKAKIIEILDEYKEELFDTTITIQNIEAELLEGPNKGTVVEIENDYQAFKSNKRVYVNHNVYIDETESYTIIGVDRMRSLILLLLIFVTVVIGFGRWQGVRSLIALSASFLIIMMVLIPGILNGWHPLVASILVAAGVLFAAIFFTHGFNRESTVAYSGTMIAVLLTSLFAAFAVSITDLSGIAADEAVYLNFNTGGTLNFTALLLGALIIGFLGVLDDIAITQSAVVTELFKSNPSITRNEVYERAMRVGREHVSALVNTLVLAYTGSALPLLLYFKLSPSGFASTINLEIIATEIVRIVVGSVGLILTVPIVTLLAVFMINKDTEPCVTGCKNPHHNH